MEWVLPLFFSAYLVFRLPWDRQAITIWVIVFFVLLLFAVGFDIHSHGGSLFGRPL
jgi:hypothetical protein